jgi:hypothetical protein
MRFAGDFLKGGLYGASANTPYGGGLLGAAGLYEPMKYDSTKGFIGSNLDNPVGGFAGNFGSKFGSRGVLGGLFG